MKLRRPQSLYGLILLGFGVVALPLLIAVVWALVNLDRLAEQSEQLVITGVSNAENSRLLAQYVGSLERVSRQYVVLRNTNSGELLRAANSPELLRQDQQTLQTILTDMSPLAAQANASALATSIRVGVRRILDTLLLDGVSDAEAQEAVEGYATLRQRANRLSVILSTHIELELTRMQESTRRAQQISAWQTAALVPGTIFLVVVFTLLVSRPIRQIDNAIRQLGRSGFAKPIKVKGPQDLEKLGEQLEWLRVRLLELAQEKNRFLRHMSHELKTPLANIREGTELLLDGSVGSLDSQQREVTDILRQNGLKLQQLIENLLSFSAWQTKNEVLTITEFPLRGLAISVAKSQSLALSAARIHLQLDVEEIVVTADRDKIRAVLDNLLSNAIKFTPAGGVISIGGHARPDGFVLEFADTGPGIPEHEGPRIFEAFFQGKRQHGGHIAGTGIGLSVVLECVQAHEGSVKLIDSDEYSGAHFRIQIPQKRATLRRKLAANA